MTNEEIIKSYTDILRNPTPPGTAVGNAMESLTSAIATPAYNQVKTGDFSYKDAMTGMMDKNKKDWEAVVKERYPKMSPLKQKVYGMFLNALLDPINLIPGAMMGGSINKIGRKLIPEESKVPSLIHSAKNDIIKGAQKILDEWAPGTEGLDEVYGAGGACDDISSHIQSVLSNKGFDVFEAGAEGSDHAYTLAIKGKRAFFVDIPPYVYESGGGYNWAKKPGVKLHPDHIAIEEVPFDSVKDIMEGY